MEFFRKGVSRISTGKRIRRGEKTIFKQKRNTSTNLRIKEEHMSNKEEKALNGKKDTETDKKYHVDVTI